MFDAYTVKKVLPRLFIAIVLIQLSWFLFTGVIKAVNAVAYGIEGLIYAPFGGLADLGIGDILAQAGGGASGLGFASIAAATAGAVMAAVAVGGVLMTAVIALLGVLLAFVLLLFRQVIIVGLLIIAPLALVAWILPSTEKYWKMWWDSFFKLLLVYPIILAMVAIGRVFATTIADIDPGAGTVSPAADIVTFFMIVACIIGPFFLIPKTFQMAGAAFGALSGALTNRAAGAKNWAKKRRAATVQKNWKETLDDNRFKGGNHHNIRGKLNKGLQAGALISSGKAGYNPFRMRSRATNLAGVAAGHEMAELLEKNEAIKAVAPDDHLTEAVQNAHGRAAIEQMLLNSTNPDGTASRWATAQPHELAQAVAMVQAAQRAGSATAVNSAMVMARAQSGTGFATAADMHEAIIAAAGGDRRLEGSLLAGARSASERARRPDLAAPGHVFQAGQMDAIRATLGGDETAHAASRAQVNAASRAEAMRESGAHAILSGRTENVQQEVQQIGADFDAAMAAGDIAQATELASQITSLRGAMGSAPPAARQAVMGLLDHVGIDPTAINPETGAAYSTDDQLGQIIHTSLSGRALDIDGDGVVRGRVAVADAPMITQEIRTRAGLYDAGGGDRTPAMMRGIVDPNQQD